MAVPRVAPGVPGRCRGDRAGGDGYDGEEEVARGHAHRRAQAGVNGQGGCRADPPPAEAAGRNGERHRRGGKGLKSEQVVEVRCEPDGHRTEDGDPRRGNARGRSADPQRDRCA
ncbi:MAG: hypothetical protein M5R36_23705 [Deltaproteobacteria bacterium]|nr:hypothetical protein [Deltaproteobacteria bacterium]